MSGETQKLKFKRFAKEYYAEYKGWFQDERIKKALYDIDDEWLDFVLSDDTGIEYAVFLGSEMIAVVGIDLPTQDHKVYAIKNIAINPLKFRKGLGTLVLKGLLELHPLGKNAGWVAYVEVDNKLAISFFIKNGWQRKHVENGMIRFQLDGDCFQE